MTGLGVFFALTPKQESALLTAHDNSAVMTLVEAIEERWIETSTQEIDTAWKEIHASLTSTTAPWKQYESVVAHCILSDQQLYNGNEFIVSFISRERVSAIAEVLLSITEDDFRIVFFDVQTFTIGEPITAEHFQYHWTWFDVMRQFFQRTKKKRRAILFTAEP
jgi:hypothetical protein